MIDRYTRPALTQLWSDANRYETWLSVELAAPRPNPRLAKSILTYDVAEIAQLYGCHRNTVRHWLSLGLQPIDDRRPILVRGDVLNEFHLSRRQSAKRPCGPGEIFCPPCGAPMWRTGRRVQLSGSGTYTIRTLQA